MSFAGVLIENTALIMHSAATPHLCPHLQLAYGRVVSNRSSVYQATCRRRAACAAPTIISSWHRTFWVSTFFFRKKFNMSGRGPKRDRNLGLE